MDKFIGCMVSLDCGETLGVYQGQVESIDPVQGTITLIRSFRNGVPYKLPHVTLSSQDIDHLEIIKSSEDAKLTTNSDHFSSKADPSICTSKENDNMSASKAKIAPIKQLVVLGKNRNETSIPAFPDISQNIKLPANILLQSEAVNSSRSARAVTGRYKGSSVTPPNNFGRTQQFDVDYYLNYQSGYNKCSDNFGEAVFYNSRDCSKIASSPLASYKMQGISSHGKYWSGDGFQNGHGFSKYRDGSKSSSVRTSNSFTEHLHYPISSYAQKGIPGYDSHFSPLSKPPRTRRNNSDCFDHCDGDFDVDFDFEKNLALFDKSAVAQELQKDTSNNGNGGPHARQSKNGYQSHQEKYKCDENILKGIEFSRRQILVTEFTKNADTSTSVIGEYSTDSGLIVPGVSQQVREKLFSTAEKMGFSCEKMVEAFGRCLSDAILQHLGGNTRFDAKNSHQRPKVVILCGSNRWQSASVIACGRLLANRSSQVTLYYSPPSSSTPPSCLQDDSTFLTELRLFKMTEGTVLTNPKDLPTDEGLDLIISTIDCQRSNKDDAIRWASNKKAPTFLVEPSFVGPPLLEGKRLFVCGLPPWFESNTSQVCFCDVGFPESVYKASGITYKSPFFDKFCITLHR